ncbi:MAG: 3-deoxy-D-manno-octulosonate 8-phosphate phosphatase [Fusobacteriia bacterium 4572_132]|nr:MAG: 3-deoxy-D-manno-octulosonate 8-phosphate phosphatase [Fusobacteriia bacterium 4572_132]
MEEKAIKIKMIILDVDGTLTDGSIHIDNNGIETKSFNVKDGFAIVSAKKMGINFAIITGRSSKVVAKRAEELGIIEIHQGIKNKAKEIEKIKEKYSLKKENIAYIGDDINDLPGLRKAGLKGTPYDGVQEVKKIADFISTAKGGEGAVREFVEYILRVQKLWKKIILKYNF